MRSGRAMSCCTRSARPKRSRCSTSVTASASTTTPAPATCTASKATSSSSTSTAQPYACTARSAASRAARSAAHRSSLTGSIQPPELPKGRPVHMSPARHAGRELDTLIDVTVDCYNEDEQLTAFENAFDEADFPCPGTVIGEDV